MSPAGLKALRACREQVGMPWLTFHLPWRHMDFGLPWGTEIPYPPYFSMLLTPFTQIFQSTFMQRIIFIQVTHFLKVNE